MNWGAVAATAVGAQVVLTYVVRFRVDWCVRRRATDPAEVRDGKRHLSVVVWVPWARKGGRAYVHQRWPEDE